MTKKDEHVGRKIAVGAALVGAVGYLTGILTAPKSGKETRHDISQKADEVKDETTEQLQNLQNELKDLLNAAKEKGASLSSSAKVEFNEAVIRAKDAENKAAHVLKAIKAGQADDPQLNKAIKQAKQAKKNLAKYLKG